MHSIAVTALACLTLAAGTPAAAAPVTGPDAAGAARLRQVWNAGPAAAAIATAPVYLAGSTYHLEHVADPAKARLLVRVIRRDAGTGRRLPFATGAVDSTMGYQPVAGRGTLYAVTFREHTTIRAFHPDGRVRWSRDQPGESFPHPPRLAGDHLITVAKSGCDVGCERTTVFAWDADDGTPAWSATLPGGSVKVATTPGYAAVQINTGDGTRLTVFDVTTGTALWTRPVPGGSGLGVDGTYAYQASGSLRAYRIRDGEPAWTGADAGYQRVFPSRSGVFVTSGDRYAAYDTTGRRRWTSGVHPRAGLTVDGGIVYFQRSGTSRGPAYLVAVRAVDGKVLSSTRIWNRVSVGDVSVGGGRVFTKALLEKIVAFAPARR